MPPLHLEEYLAVLGIIVVQRHHSWIGLLTISCILLHKFLWYY